LLLTTSSEVKTQEVGYAVEVTRRKGAETDWIMYELINRKPWLNAYELAKRLGWSTGKAYGSIKRLEKKRAGASGENRKRRETGARDQARQMARLLHSRRAGRVQEDGILRCTRPTGGQKTPANRLHLSANCGHDFS